MDASQKEVHDAYAALYKYLDDAYWAASTIEGKDFIRGAADAVSDCVTALDVEDIKSRTADFKRLSEQVQMTQTKLNKLKEQIDDIIHKVDVAKSVTDAIGKAVSLAAKFFP